LGMGARAFAPRRAPVAEDLVVEGAAAGARPVLGSWPVMTGHSVKAPART